MEKKKIVFAIPGKEISRGFFHCWNQVLIACLEQNLEVAVSQQYSSHFPRSKCLGADQTGPIDKKPFSGAPYDYIMWIDPNTIFEPKQVFALIAAAEKENADIVAGIYNLDADHIATIQTLGFEKNSFMTIEEVEEAGAPALRRVDYTGLGFALFRYGAIEALPFPWCWRAPDAVPAAPHNLHFSTEDEAMFRNLADAGIKVHVDLSVKVGMERQVIF